MTHSDSSRFDELLWVFGTNPKRTLVGLAQGCPNNTSTPQQVGMSVRAQSSTPLGDLRQLHDSTSRYSAQHQSS